MRVHPSFLCEYVLQATQSTKQQLHSSKLKAQDAQKKANVRGIEGEMLPQCAAKYHFVNSNNWTFQQKTHNMFLLNQFGK
jgi:hypothetical protein